MKRLAVLLLLLLPVTAHGQAVVQDGQEFRGILQGQAQIGIVRADSTAKILTVDSDGNLLTSPANPEYLFDWKYQSFLQTTLVAGNDDSVSTPRDTRGWKHMALTISGCPDSAQFGGFLVAVSVRGHLTAAADSNGTFAWASRELNTQAVGTSQPRDTIGQAVDFTAATKTEAVGDEFVVWIPYCNGQTTLGVKNLWVPLNRNGDWFSAPYTSIRVRALGGYTAALATTTNGRVKLKFDLVGWR